MNRTEQTGGDTSIIKSSQDRAVPGVEAPVFDEVGVLPEALPAVGAAEGPLLCVCALVQEQIAAGLKPLPTLPTLVEPLPSWTIW